MILNSRKKVLGIFFFLFFIGSTALIFYISQKTKEQQDVRSKASGGPFYSAIVTINGTNPKSISEKIWGVNFWPETTDINQVPNLLSSYNRDAARALGIKMIRYVGGCGVDGVDANPISGAIRSIQSRPGDNFETHYMPTFDAVLALADQIGASVLYGVNVETKGLSNPCGWLPKYPNLGSEADNKVRLLADLAGVVNTYKSRIHYYELGNEPWGSWSPETYVTTAREFAQVIKTNDPTAKVILVGYPSTGNNMNPADQTFQKNRDWTVAVKYHLNDQCSGVPCFDAISDHPYVQQGYSSPVDRAMPAPIPLIPDGSSPMPRYQSLVSSWLDAAGTTIYYYLCSVNHYFGGFGSGYECSWYQTLPVTQVNSSLSQIRGATSYTFFKNNIEMIGQILLDAGGQTQYSRECTVERSNGGLNCPTPWSTYNLSNLRGIGNEAYTDIDVVVYPDTANHQKLRLRLTGISPSATVYERTCDFPNGILGSCTSFTSFAPIPNVPLLGVESFLFRANQAFDEPQNFISESFLALSPRGSDTQDYYYRKCKVMADGTIGGCGGFSSFDVSRIRKTPGNPPPKERYLALDNTVLYTDNPDSFSLPSNIPGTLAYYAAKDAFDRNAGKIGDYSPKPLDITEWNTACWGPFGKFNISTGTVDHGFFIAESLLQMAKQGVEMGAYHDYTFWSTSMPRASCDLFQTQTPSSYTFSPSGQAFALTSAAAGGQYYATTAIGAPNLSIPSNPRCEGYGCLRGGYNVSKLSSYGVRSADQSKLYVFLLNRDTDNEARVTLSLLNVPGSNLFNKYKVKVLDGSGDFATVDFSASETGAQNYDPVYTIITVPKVGMARVELFNVPLPTRTPTPTRPPTLTPTPTPVGYVFLLNQATGQNCNAVCASQGKTCLRIGTDPNGTNYLYKIYKPPPFPQCTQTGGNCATVMSKIIPNRACEGKTINWTYCRCADASTPTPTSASTPTPTRTPTPTPILPSCPPNFVLPRNGERVASRNPILRWARCAGAIRYQLNINGKGIGHFISQPLLSPSFLLRGSQLVSGSNYTWKVRGCTDTTCSVSTPWSNTATFLYSPPTVTEGLKQLER